MFKVNLSVITEQVLKMNLELTGSEWVTGTKPKWEVQGAITVSANSAEVRDTASQK